MKAKIYLIFFCIVFLECTSCFAQVPNCGFEDWAVASNGYFEPVGWQTNNGNSQYPGTAVLQTAGRTGNYAVKLVSLSDNTGSYLGGYVHIKLYAPIKPLSISGYWSGYFPTTITYLTLHLLVFDSPPNIIANEMHYSASQVSLPWTYFSFPINYTSNNTPYATDIGFNLVTDNIAAHGEIDDLTLTYATSTNEIHTMHLLGSALERDATGNYFLNMNLLSPLSFTLNIFSADGKRVSEKQYSLASGNQHIPINTNELAGGVYLCRVVSDSIDKSFKFIK
jgi:hypothetical protein